MVLGGEDYGETVGAIINRPGCIASQGFKAADSRPYGCKRHASSAVADSKNA